MVFLSENHDYIECNVFCIDFLIYTVQSDHDRTWLYFSAGGTYDMSLLPIL